MSIDSCGIELELTGPRPRQARLRSGPVLRYVGWVVVLAGLWLGLVWSVVGNAEQLRALASGGAHATAQVIGREVEPAGARYGYVHYAFRAGGQLVESRFRVTRDDYVSYPTGASLLVTYLARDPRVHRLGVPRAAEVQRSLDSWLVAGSGLFSLLVFLLVERVTQIVRLLGIARWGEAVQATVTGVDKRGQVWRRVTYDFATSSGQMVSGSCKWPQSAGAVAPRDPITVLYVSQKRSCNAPYRLVRRFVSLEVPPRPVLSITYSG